MTGALGVPPTKLKLGGSGQPLPTCPRAGPKTLADHQQTRVGKKSGVEGAEPPPRGLWGMFPQSKIKG